jgi:hypothetical protein
MSDAELKSSNLELLKSKSADVRKLLDDAFTEWGLDLGVTSIHLTAAKSVLKCPPGYAPSFEPIEHPDGTVSYQWVCKKI